MNRLSMINFAIASTALLMYGSVVFLMQSALFGLYQFLRDRGYGFWTTNLTIAILFMILSTPSICRIVLGKTKKR